MNKFLIVICFISIFHYSQTQNISNDTIIIFTDYFIEAAKGMSKNETNQVCVNAFIENKQELVNLFIIAFDSITKGNWDFGAIIPYIQIFVPKCYDFFLFVQQLFFSLDKEKIQQYGVNMMIKSKIIDKNMQIIMGSNNTNTTLFNVGRILSTIMDFQFN